MRMKAVAQLPRGWSQGPTPAKLRTPGPTPPGVHPLRTRCRAMTPTVSPPLKANRGTCGALAASGGRKWNDVVQSRAGESGTQRAWPPSTEAIFWPTCQQPQDRFGHQWCPGSCRTPIQQATLLLRNTEATHCVYTESPGDQLPDLTRGRSPSYRVREWGQPQPARTQTLREAVAAGSAGCLPLFNGQCGTVSGRTGGRTRWRGDGGGR